MKSPIILEESGRKYIEVAKPSIFHSVVSALIPSLFARVQMRHRWIREPDGSTKSGIFYVVPVEEMTKIFPKFRSHPVQGAYQAPADHWEQDRQAQSGRPQPRKNP